MVNYRVRMIWVFDNDIPKTTYAAQIRQETPFSHKWVTLKHFVSRANATKFLNAIKRK